MAKDTNLSLRNQMIYQVFPRQYSDLSNFQGIFQDLDRIRQLGVDILYLLPIHPIGKKNRKGSVGCPYSIQDYWSIEPSLGTLEDFKQLIDGVHQHRMKLMIDVVFNHTSRDSEILKKHPEWMYCNEHGEFSGKVGDWWDVTDLDFTQKELWQELLKVLCYWANLGVDGFRCDVASMVPLEFWKLAREELLKINPNFILLAESIEVSFVKHIRDLGFEASSDCELYEAFDMEYDYDIWEYYEHYIQTGEGLNTWLKEILRQEGRYPENYVKIRCLENHDRHRVSEFIKDGIRLRNLHATMFFLKGAAFVYAGSEAVDEKLESLFEKDLVDWSNLGKFDLPALLKRCSEIKKAPIFKNGIFDIHLSELEVIHITYRTKEEMVECLFNVGNIQGFVPAQLMDGQYSNLFDGSTIQIQDGRLHIGENPIILKTNN